MKKNAAEGADPNSTEGKPAYMPLTICLNAGGFVLEALSLCDVSLAAVETLWRAFWRRVLIVSSG